MSLGRAWLLLLVFLCRSLAAGEVTDPLPDIATAYLVEIDGVQRWALAPDRRLPPASLTKLLTALLVVEGGRLDDSVRVSPSAAQETGTRIGLRTGEHWPVRALLAASLIASANDACQALAIHLAGTASRFVSSMNRRAVELGLTNSHFTNACGHHAADHYSSASDLATLAKQALLHSEIADLVALPSLRIASEKPPRSIELLTSNALLGRYRGVIGVKTGYTVAAGKCLIALAEQADRRVLLVLLDAKDRWWSASDLLDLAFAAENDPR